MSHRKTWHVQGHKLRRFLRHLTSGISVIAVSVSILPKPANSFVDPVTVATVATTGQMILAAGRDVPNVDGVIQQVQLTALLEVHNRLDAIENTLGAIVTQVASLPEDIRKAISEGFDQDKIDEFRGAMETVRRRCCVTLARRGSHRDFGLLSG